MHALAHAYKYCPLCRLSNALWQQVPVHARSVRPADYKSTCWLLFACLFKFLFLFFFLSFFFLSFFFFFLFFFSFDPWCVGVFSASFLTNSTFQSFHKLSSGAGRSPRGEELVSAPWIDHLYISGPWRALFFHPSFLGAVGFCCCFCEHWTSHSLL